MIGAATTWPSVTQVVLKPKTLSSSSLYLVLSSASCKRCPGFSFYKEIFFYNHFLLLFPHERTKESLAVWRKTDG
jgi:hypothetical protein